MLSTPGKLVGLRPAAAAAAPAPKRQRTQAPAKASDAPDAGSQGVRERMPYNYNSSDGRRKATLEDAFVSSREASGAGQIAHNTGMAHAQPWNLGWQVSERNLMWNDGLAAKLLKRVAAEELDCEESELEARFSELAAVMPGLAAKLHTVKPRTLAALAQDPAAIAARLLRLRTLFPTANVEQMALRDFGLLLARSADGIEAAAAELREILPPDVDLDRLCEEHPSMLQTESFRAALDEVKRLMPKLDISHALTTQPEIIFSAQRTKSMIPYDPVPGNPH